MKLSALNRSGWALVLSAFVAAWTIDRLTKIWALENLSNLQFYGFFGLVLHRNPGAMLGLFSDLPPILRVVSLSTGGAFLFFTYLVIQYLLPHRTIVLRIGLSFLLGGILGNVADRIVWGAVVDFLVLGTSRFYSPAFNFADAIQWVGYGMIVFSLVRNADQIWPDYNVRRSYWVNPSFQIKFCLMLVAVGFCFSFIMGVYSYTFLRVTLEEMTAVTYEQEMKYLKSFLVVFSVIVVFFLSALFLVGRLLSHRMAGPLYAFERFLDDLLKGHSRPLRLRAGDEFPELIALATKLRTELESYQTLLKQAEEAKQKSAELKLASGEGSKT